MNELLYSYFNEMVDNIEIKVKNKIISKWLMGKNMTFHSFDTLSKDKILVVFKRFSKQIFQIYWSQKSAFRKVFHSWDRNAYILEVEWKDIWTLIYKNILEKSDEQIICLNWYIEIKSMFLYDKEAIWLWYAYVLFSKLLTDIQQSENLKNADWIYVTVSEHKANSSLNRFISLWFKIVRVDKDRYSKWENEVVLYYNFTKNERNWM